MWFRNREQRPTLLEEHVQKLWDQTSRLKQLEDRFEERLDELSKRYRRAEQSEARFERKKEPEECDDCEDESGVHPAIAALKKRQNNVKPARAGSRTG